MPKGPILYLSQGDKILQYLGPYSTESGKAGRSEIHAARGNQGPAQPQLTHRAAISTKQETADPLTQMGPSLETDSWFIRNYTLLDKLGRTKMGTGAGGTHPHFPQKTE